MPHLIQLSFRCLTLYECFTVCSKVDNNDAYDDLAVLNADAEEKYFDDEDPESIHSDSNL